MIAAKAVAMRHSWHSYSHAVMCRLEVLQTVTNIWRITGREKNGVMLHSSNKLCLNLKSKKWSAVEGGALSSRQSLMG